ncbi:Aldehyde reductase 2 [Fusarium oxysporum f. sp. cubense race 1]|uniref:Aldehyde reductase 2 n=1 Tax=Fusarium oxysporum f. sp. cubense (strain race 1) TaxID=1229664 RepID=N4UWM7_FUSC1|nr:Aldehyde reductase 2 [Fusarium oxysporum f. sp. cubense race 1]
MRIFHPAIPFGSTVVVIGTNGYMGIETCEKLLQAGFFVRGTVRDVEENRQWMYNLFDTKWPNMFELVHVSDFEAEGAFDEALEGAKGVINVSTPIILNPDPAKVVEPVIKGTINSLEAVAHAGVKRYVLSSSSKAVESTNYNHPHHITSSMLNYEAIREACCEPNFDGLDRFMEVYSASRALAELAFWSWVGTNQPPFVANCVVPDGQFGRALDPENTASTFRMLKGAAEGEWDKVFGQVAYYTDVQDAARLLVAAVALPSLVNERIFAYCHNSTWNELRYKIRLISPNGEKLVKGEGQAVKGRDVSNVDGLIKRAECLARDWSARLCERGGYLK